MDAAEWSETIDTNLTGVFNAMRAAAPHMRRQRWGRIIGISSMMGRTAQPGIPAYVASKWGVIGLCKSVALELAAVRGDRQRHRPGQRLHPDDPQRRPSTGWRDPISSTRPRDDVAPAMAALHVQPVPWLEPEEITAAVVYLASEAGPPHHRLGHRRGRRRLGPVHRLIGARPVPGPHWRDMAARSLGLGPRRPGPPAPAGPG